MVLFQGIHRRCARSSFIRSQYQSISRMTTETKPPVPPFTYEDAVKKVRMAEDAWNTRNPDKVKEETNVVVDCLLALC